MLTNVLSKRLLSLCLALAYLVITASPTSAQDESLSTLTRRVKHAVVVITTYDCLGNPILRGNGFFIESNYLVTDRHVLVGACSAQIRTFDGRTYPVEGVAAINERRDLALLQASTPSSQITTLSVENTIPREGEEIIVVSKPRGDWNISKGSALGVWDFQNVGELIRLTASISAGSSGSPVVNRRGLVVGVILMQVKSAEDLNFAVPGGQITALERSGPSRTLASFNAPAQASR